jgi:hypothetical protein
MCNGALSAHLTADVRALLSLPRLSAANWKRLRTQCAYRGRPGHLAVRQSRASRSTGGRPHEIHRCTSCKVAVWSTYGGISKLRFVRVGTLDDPAALTPDVHIYVRSKLPWVALPEGVPSFAAYYDSRKLWPPASLERRRVIMG